MIDNCSCYIVLEDESWERKGKERRRGCKRQHKKTSFYYTTKPNTHERTKYVPQLPVFTLGYKRNVPSSALSFVERTSHKYESMYDNCAEQHFDMVSYNFVDDSVIIPEHIPSLVSSVLDDAQSCTHL